MKIYKIFLILGICSLSFACQQNITSSVEINMPPIRERVNNLVSEALKWDGSAYLYSVTVPVSEDASAWKLTAAFNSPSKPYNSLILELSTAGKIETIILDIPTQVSQRKPILDKDWPIDSDKAINNFIMQEPYVMDFLMSNKRHCSDMKLERFSTDTTNRPVVWSLSLFDCISKSEYYYLNPITGEMLNLSHSIVPDSVLISPSP